MSQINPESIYQIFEKSEEYGMSKQLFILALQYVVNQGGVDFEQTLERIQNSRL